MDEHHGNALIPLPTSELMNLLGKDIVVNTNSLHQSMGCTIAVDPESSSFILFDGEDCEWFPGHQLSNIVEIRDTNHMASESLNQVRKLLGDKGSCVQSSEANDEKKRKYDSLIHYLAAKKIPQVVGNEETFSISITKSFRIDYPYGKENCHCALPRVLEVIRAKLGEYFESNG